MEESEEFNIRERTKTVKELFEIYEEIVLGLAELPLGDDNGRKRIARATQRIGKLLGLDKITKGD